MTDKEYHEWFIRNIEMFSSLGIMHPNSEWGRIIKICISACEERIGILEQRVIELEQQKQYDKKEPAKRGRKKKESINIQ